MSMFNNLYIEGMSFKNSLSSSYAIVNQTIQTLKGVHVCFEEFLH